MDIIIKVSIVIPVYNVEKYLEECIESAIKQSLNDIEIICINDGSTDSSLEILKKYEKTLQALSGQKIVNLGTQTNTDLKIAYGTASLPALTDYEQNFTTLCQTLTAYAGQLIELGHTNEARTILEYGISIGSDLSQNYLLLAEIYQSSGDTEQIRKLLSSAEQLDSLMKRSIVEKLTAMLPEESSVKI